MGAWTFSDPAGLARSLAGPADRFTRASAAALQPGANDFAVCAWAKFSGFTAGQLQGVVGKIGAIGNYGWMLYAIEDGGQNVLRFGVSGDGTAWVEVDPDTPQLSADTWALLWGWWDVSLGSVWCEVNEGDNHYSQAGGPAGIYASTAMLSAGAEADGTYPLDGALCKLGYWIGSFPSPAQRAMVYNAGKGVTLDTLPDELRTNLVGWWDGDEPSGNLLDDFGGYDMTAVGTPGSAAGPDAADAWTFTPSKAPIYPPEPGRLCNVLSGETLGGKVRAETRGSDRRMLRLAWKRVTQTDAEGFDTLQASYGARKAPVKLELPAGALPNIAATTKLRVRVLDLRMTWVAYQRYNVDLVVQEDLA